MGIGVKIKEFRSKNRLTQKELADKLNVTYQAVSRWENDEVEPSFDTVKEMSKIFGCTIDELFGINNGQQQDKVVVQDYKPVLAVCEKCNRPIYNSNEIMQYDDGDEPEPRRCRLYNRAIRSGV